MKKLLCLLLCTALLAGISIPVLAAEDGADARLARITQAVKSTLELDTERYDSFQGDCYEQELAPTWALRWSGADGSLTVEALEDGTVVSYRLSEPDQPDVIGSGIPAYPAGSAEAVKQSAAAFLAKVLDPSLETVELGDPEGLDQLDRSNYYFSGVILLNGLPSPLHYSLTVRASDGQVLRFWRDAAATTCLGDIPGASAAVTQDQAAQKLRSTLSLRLEYVLPEDGGTTAVLRYLPDNIHEFYVDAQTGALVDLTELEQKMYGGMKGESANDTAAAEAPAEAGGSGLSEAEQAGIGKLDGVLSQTALDTKLRAVQEYGLGRYTLTSAAYELDPGEDGESETVLCTLRYSRTAQDSVFFRTFTVDAHTGVVQRIYSSAPWDDTRSTSLSVSQAQARAEAFLKTYYGDHFAHLALYQTDNETSEGAPAYYFTFARKENGYFFPENAYTIGIDVSDGSVSRLSFQYDEETVFDSPDGVLSAESARDRWMGTYEVALSYLLVPVKLDRSDPAANRLIQMGLEYYYNMKLGYCLDRESYYLGIDAKSGHPIEPEVYQSVPAYSDLAGHWARADIEQLAQYGVGYDADVFQPRKALTQLDLVCLLASLQGYRLNPATDDTQAINEAYAIAYSMGALTRAERQEDALITRGNLVKYLLNSAGYGPVARLEGIFTCSYPDRASIPASDLGYAALAQGLKLIQGAYDGAKNATRAEAAVMLSRLMAH